MTMRIYLLSVTARISNLSGQARDNTAVVVVKAADWRRVKGAQWPVVAIDFT